MTDNLAEYVKSNFAGMLVFGDIHGDFDSFEKAHTFAVDNNLFFMSLGDLVDRGRKPFETVMKMAKMVLEGKGAFTIGNHDDKFCRFAKGSTVSFSKDARQTLDDVTPERMDEFLTTYLKMVETPMFSSLFHKFDDITLVHASSHPSIWEDAPKFGKTERSRFLVGEVSGEIYPDGYPVRLYTWIDEIPKGKTVVVGHDKQPIHNIPILAPMVVTNSVGGMAVFLDTGCGKGGFLSGAVMVPGENGFVINSYTEFK